MKLNTQQRNVQSNMGEMKQFQISTSSKLFTMLSDLYQDKVFAIMRELGTNAYDAHVSADKAETPFFVHLPTYIEPWFAIRDYGTGMSHEEVMNLYITYGDSNKTESNDFNGMLGVGSKSPFAYTDNFTVHSIQNGVKNSYLAFIDKGNIPAISHVNTEATTEANGLQVQFPVRQQDFRLFSMKLREVYKPFRIQPETNFEQEIVLQSIYDIIEDDPQSLENTLNNGTQYYFTDRQDGLATYTVLQGNVAYPFNIDKLDTDLSKDELTFLNYYFNRYGSQKMLLLEVPIGTVDFTPSREAISYTTPTKKFLAETVREVIAIHEEMIYERASQKDTFLNALHFYETHNSLGTKETAQKFLKEMCQKHGIDQTKWDVWRNNQLVFGVAIKYLSDHPISVVYEDTGVRKVNMNFSVSKVESEYMPLKDIVDKDRSFLYADLEKTGYTDKQITYRVKRHIKSDKGQFRNHNVSDIVIIYDKSFFELTGIDNYWEFNDSLADLSALREARQRTGGGGNRNSGKDTPRYRLYNAVHGQSKKMSLKELEQVLADHPQDIGKIFVGYEHRTRFINAAFRHDVNDALFDISLRPEEIVQSGRFSIVLVDKVEVKNGRFKKFIDGLQNAATADTIINEIVQKAKSLPNVQKYFNTANEQVNRTVKEILWAYVDTYGNDDAADGSPVHKLNFTDPFYIKNDLMSDFERKVINISSVFHRINRSLNSQASVAEELNERYPLLQHLSPYVMARSDEEKNFAAEYVHLIEQKYKQQVVTAVA